MARERLIPLRSLGASGLEISRIGLGLAAVARPGYITLGRLRDLPGDRTPEALYRRCADLLDTARAAGVRYFDVARSYGRAEEFLARWLRDRQVPLEATTIGSKWGYRYTAGWKIDARVHEEKELSQGRFIAQLAESRRQLGERLDLYQIHSATIESGCLDDEGLLRALVEHRRSDDYRAVGLTLSGPASAKTLERALGKRIDGERVFDVVQATFNCLEPSLAPLLAQAHRAGLGVIVKEAFANGRLSAASQRAEDAALVARLEEIARRRGLAIDQLAVGFVLSHPFVDVILSGAATTAQLASHLATLDLVDVPLGAELEQLARLSESPDLYWATRSRLPWS